MSWSQQDENAPGGLPTLQQLVQKYRRDRTGIGKEYLLRNVCIECGSSDVDKDGSKRHCQNGQCRAQWYSNGCWDCRDGRVDSRDLTTPQCAACGWRSCSECGACKEGCVRMSGLRR